MERINILPRPNWQQRVQEMGLTYYQTPDGQPYWDESACYAFHEDEIEVIEAATNELHKLCLAACDKIVKDSLYERLKIPEMAWAAVAASWQEFEPSLYGRFDLAYEPGKPPKMLEYNADTPTALVEAAVIQWHWLQDVDAQKDQFNSLWEALVERWKLLRSSGRLKGMSVYFACAEEEEDVMTVSCLQDTAGEANVLTTFIPLENIGWDAGQSCFVDEQGTRMRSIFKLYPWEWMVHDEFGINAVQTRAETQWIEPMWKMMLSNKALLAILWEMFPDHPNLLPAFIGSEGTLTEYVRKPIYSREGANVEIHAGGGVNESTGGRYGAEGYVFQALANLPDFSGNHPVIGSWIVGDTAHGIGIRESAGMVTDNLSRFVPHYFA
ncbi:MAG: glutathionylspermidine synthase family protein [Armatimonadetes bacterium]|nr:glutathionylspermidine synthase family protein [Armatimonadota bacterium]